MLIVLLQKTVYLQNSAVSSLNHIELVPFELREIVRQVGIVLSELYELSLQGFRSFLEFIVLQLEIGILFIDFSILIVPCFHFSLQLVQPHLEFPLGLVYVLIAFYFHQLHLIILFLLELIHSFLLVTQFLKIFVIVKILLVPELLGLGRKLSILILHLLDMHFQCFILFGDVKIGSLLLSGIIWSVFGISWMVVCMMFLVGLGLCVGDGIQYL